MAMRKSSDPEVQQLRNNITLQEGMKINKLTLLQREGTGWKCKCDCGNIIVVTRPYRLKNELIGNVQDHTGSCGCIQSKTGPKNANRNGTKDIDIKAQIFYDWKVISKESLISIKNYLQQLPENSFLDTNPELSIKRTHPVSKTINGFDFMWTKVEYPLLVYKFGNFEIVAEIKTTEKQYAIGTQPMLYLCFPITELENSENLLGRTALTKELANFVINDNNVKVFLEMLKLFGTLSKSHNKDIIRIIDVILS